MKMGLYNPFHPSKRWKVTVVAEKRQCNKIDWTFAPSEPVPPISVGFIQFSGNADAFSNNIGDVKIDVVSIPAYSFNASSCEGIFWKTISLEIQSSSSIGDYAFAGVVWNKGYQV